MRIRLMMLMLCLFSGTGFSAMAQALVLKNIGAVTPLSWGDYDNDGDMDLLQFNGTELRILKNNLIGTTATFVDAGITLVNLNPSSVGWTDYNSDGYLDIYYLEAGSLKVFINQKGLSFIQTTIGTGGENLSSIGDWGDIDNDGDLDIVSPGIILKNVGSNRFEVSQRLGTTGRTELLDYDYDGDLDFYNRDLLYSNKGGGVYELDKTISPYGSSGGYEHRDLIFMDRNSDGSNFFAAYYSLDIGFQGFVSVWDFRYCGGGSQGAGPLSLQYVEIADFDNDGKNDVLFYENNTINLYTSTNDNCSIIASLSVPLGRTEVADFDKDGDLDLFIGSNVYENTTLTTNAAPSVPAGLTSVVTSLSATTSSVNFSWSASTDDKTHATSLTYNLIVKRGPDIVLTAGLGASGTMVLPKRGNAGFVTASKISNLPKGKYTWTVQAVDVAFKPSALAAEKSFEIIDGPDLTTSLPISAKYTSSYDEVNDRYLLTYLKSGDVMGMYVDGKAVQPAGVEFKINTTSSATSHVTTFNATRNEFMVSWLEVTGNNKKIYAKNLIATGANSHAEKVIYSRSDTLRVFLAGDKIAVEPVSGKYMVPVLQTRTDLSRSKVRFEDVPVTYYPYGLIDLFGVKFSSAGTNITNETPKLLQTKNIPDYFLTPQTRGFTIESAVDFDSKQKMYAVAWNFFGERRNTYGGGSSGEITSILNSDDIKLIITDEALVTKSENVVVGGGTPRNLSTIYNTLSDQLILVWSGWTEGTNGTGSNDFEFEVYQRIFSLQNNGTVTFRNSETIVSKPPKILNYGSGLPSLSWSRKRNEYLIVWNKGTAGNDRGVLGEGDIFWRRVSPVTFGFIDLDSRFLSGLVGNESITSYNGKAGHFLLGWRSSSQNYLSAFTIPKDLAKPKLLNISPDIAAAGAKILITTNNTGNSPTINKVMFGTIEAIVDPVFPFPNDPTKIQVTVPSGLTREKVRVVVTYDDQSSVEEVMFENITPSSITNVVPLQGEEGDIITITGTNFPTDKNNFKVMFGSTEAATDDITSNNVSEIKVKVPQAAIRGSQKVSVVIQEIANDFAGGDFRVIRIPAITSVNSEVIVDGEEIFISLKSITITGQNLSDVEGDVIVKLNDVTIPEESLIEQTRTVLKFLIPIGLEGAHKVNLSSADGDIFSEEFNIVLGSTVDAIPDVKEVAFTDLQNDVKLSMSVYNSQTVDKTRLWTKGISAPDSEWKSRELSIAYKNNTLDLLFTEQEFPDDELGLDAYYEVVDKSTLIERSDTFKVFYNYQVSGETANIPSLTFGGDVSDYNIISIPYELFPNKINTVFKSIFDKYGYDKTKWRILHYTTSGNTGEYKEYLDGLDVIESGKGYWIVVRNPQEITFEKGNTVNTSGGPFEMTLTPGWNQIGNPYDFNISWTDILNFNEDLGDKLDQIEPYKTYTGGAFVNTNTIDKFRGGFVRNNGETIKLKIPFTKNASINNGRTATDESFPSDLNEKEWRIALNLSAGQLKNRISSFGMHPKGTDGEDVKDEHRLPAFIKSLDLEFPHALSTSVVATGDNYTWDFNVFNTTDSKEVTLNWDNTSLGENDRQLFLHDRTGERLINMREQNNYTFTYQEGHRFNIYFGDHSYIEDHSRPGNIVLSDAYPNPMKGTATIPFTVTMDQTDVQLAIYNLQGKEITTLVNKRLAVGFYELEWDGRSTTGEQIPSGIVMYRLHTSQSGSASQSIVKKLVIAP